MEVQLDGRRREVVVVGGGQAGLAIGYYLSQQGRDFVILEASDESAIAWRQRWDSLKLFTPVRYSSLPGLSFPGDPDGYPGRDDVVAYLTAYAHRFDLPVMLGTRVLGVRRGNGTYEIDTVTGMYEADQVVIATGPFQVPFTPSISQELDPDIVQFHSSSYKAPDDVPDGQVLVVGGGNTGYQIAEELVRTHDVHLSIGAKQKPLPQRLFGRDIFSYLDRTGLIRKTRHSRIGRRMADRDTLVGSNPRALRRSGVILHGRAEAAQGLTITFSDGQRLTPRSVIWATGFRPDHSWIDLPIFDDEGRVSHERGVTTSPGFYFLGLSWMHTRGSALLGWVKEDAEYLAEVIDMFPPLRRDEIQLSMSVAGLG